MASHLAPKVDGKEGIGPLGSSSIYVVVILLSFSFFCSSEWKFEPFDADRKKYT